VSRFTSRYVLGESQCLFGFREPQTQSCRTTFLLSESAGRPAVRADVLLLGRTLTLSSVAVRLGPVLAGPALCVSALRGVPLLSVAPMG